MRNFHAFHILRLVTLTLAVIVCFGCKKDNNEITVKDIDGNSYNTTTIGYQVWMTTNLSVTKYNDGTPIPLITENSEWASLKTPGYCWYENNETSSLLNNYGALYNWFTVDTRRLCPSGWHVPTVDEWQIMIDNTNGNNLAGASLKETGTKHWKLPNTGATNESGFTALPASSRSTDGTYGSRGTIGGWWSSTYCVESQISAWDYLIYFDDVIIKKMGLSKQLGLSVRCIKN